MPSEKVDRLKAELSQLHISLAIENGFDVEQASQSADEVAESIGNFARNGFGRDREEDQAYREEIDSWYASGPVCANDPESQIAWLKVNGDETVLHAAAWQLNIGDDFEVLSWVLQQRNTSLSAASYQLVGYVLAGCLGENLPCRSLMKKVAKNIRSGFYRGTAGLPPYRHGGSREAYAEALVHASDKAAWIIPNEAFGPFPECGNMKSPYNFEDGAIRLSFEEWQKRKSK